MTDCLFCKIANGEIKTLKIYEDSSGLAFLDVNPCSPGHTIIIPKKHYQKLDDMPEEEAKELFSVIFKLTKIIPKTVGTTDCNIGVNNGKFAGQEVQHLHFHIIPRFEGDKGMPIQGLVRSEVNKDELPELAEKLSKEIGNSGETEEKPKPKGEKTEGIKEKSVEQKTEQEAEKPTKSSEREWQEFNFGEQDKAMDFSEARRE